MNQPFNLSQQPGARPDPTGRIPSKNPYTFEVIQPGSQPPKNASGPQSLPPGWEDAGVITFSIAGARTTGKSIYIAIAVKMLEQLVPQFGGTFSPGNAATRDSYARNYGEPLFGGQVLEATAPADNPDAYQREPLIFDLGYPERKGVEERQRIYVVFRDIAGEDLEWFDPLAMGPGRATDPRKYEAKWEQLRFLPNSDSVIYLYDPLAVEEVRTLVEAVDNAGTDARSEANPVEVLRSVVTLLGGSRPDISLTLAKFDLIQNIEGMQGVRLRDVNWPEVMGNLGAAFRRAGSGTGRTYDHTDAELIHEETRSMLLGLGADTIFNSLERPDSQGGPHRYHCHVVSSLGAAPTGSSISDYGIAPFRVLDPLRRVFAQYGLFVG